jgi:uncharacterized membrane protein YkoI
MRHLPATLMLIGVLAGCSHEKTISMAEMPAAPRATLDAEAKGGKVTEVEKETKDGKTVYCADVTSADGKKWDVEIGEDGKLISKKPD